MAVLSVKDLHKFYRKGFMMKKSPVLKGVSFSLGDGRMAAFIGVNGAGKTTVLKCLLGLVLPEQGEVTFFDDQPLSEETKAKIGFLPERPYFYEFLTAEEFLKFHLRLSGLMMSKKEMGIQIEKTLESVGLSDASDSRLSGFSKGMLQRIGIAQSMIHEPKFLVLDEPMSGLDPDGRYQVKQIIQEIADRGTSILLTSHLLHDAQELCDDLIAIHNGKILYEGELQSLIDQHESSLEVEYYLDGKVKRTTFENFEGVQKFIDQTRSQGGVIQEVVRKKADLESVFHSMVESGGIT